jgi:hypothetical protein
MASVPDTASLLNVRPAGQATRRDRPDLEEDARMGWEPPNEIEALPVVAIDETGSTGPNLLDQTQPVFAIAAVQLADDVAKRIVDDQLTPEQDELHFVRLQRSGPGRQQVLAVLGDSSLTETTARVSVLHKPWTTTGKVIDLLFEPVIDALNQDLYSHNRHVALANFIAIAGPKACGTDAWGELIEASMWLIRRGGELDVYEYQAALGKCRAICRDGHLAKLLEMLPDRVDQLVAMLPRARLSVEPLDPAPTVVYEQALEWSDRVGWFVLEHDPSEALSHAREQLLKFSDPAEASKFDISESAPLLPLKLAEMRPRVSQDAPAIQIADVLAGACRVWLTATLGLPVDDRFVAAIEETGAARFIKHWVWPPELPLADQIEAASPRQERS